MQERLRDRPHLFLRGGGQAEQYTSRGSGRTPDAPPRERETHANELERAIGQAVLDAQELLQNRDPAIAAGEPGFYLEIELDDARRVAVDKLSNRVKGVELVAVREHTDGTHVTATVFVPQAAEQYFLQKVREYREAETRTGKPKNEPLVARMEMARIAAVHSLYTDDDAFYPTDGRAVWWEVWLRAGRLEVFAQVAQRLGVNRKPNVINFPEREVILALADEATLAQLIQHSDAVAELRMAKDTPALFMRMPAIEQREWANDLLQQLTPPAADAPAVCLLDSGIAQAHPLLQLALDPADLHTYDPAWGTSDSNHWQGHGTAMAGLALYGDLLEALSAVGPMELRHRLESVKILHPGGVQNDPLLYGAITKEAVGRAEIQAPFRRRAVCLAITSQYGQRGRPSSWSAAVDQLCQEPGAERLVIISAGNIGDELGSADYLNRNDVESVEDPAQAWNALTVGAYTEKTTLLDKKYAGYTPLAPAGDLSPCSRTSVTWQRQWPIKPDVVLEGGNLAVLGEQAGDAADDLSLLTTFHRHNERIFTTSGDTSAATALAGCLAAEILAAQPELWPETVRALMVHSAEWTPAMVAQRQATNLMTVIEVAVKAAVLAHDVAAGLDDAGEALGSRDGCVGAACPAGA